MFRVQSPWSSEAFKHDGVLFNSSPFLASITTESWKLNLTVGEVEGPGEWQFRIDGERIVFGISPDWWQDWQACGQAKASLAAMWGSSFGTQWWSFSADWTRDWIIFVNLLHSSLVENIQ